MRLMIQNHIRTDSVRLAGDEVDETLYTEADMQACLDKIEVVDFHQARSDIQPHHGYMRNTDQSTLHVRMIHMPGLMDPEALEGGHRESIGRTSDTRFQEQ